jgi:membrane-bound serine protease (ClpP class)
MHTLPVNYAGLALIVFSLILFILEVKIVSHGLLTAGGIISLILGSVMLIQTESALDVVSLSWQVIVAVVVMTTAFFAFAIGMGIKAQRRTPTTGIQGLVGETGAAIADLTPRGQVSIHGEIWTAVSLDGSLNKGTRVRIEDVDNLTLKVKKLE